MNKKQKEIDLMMISIIELKKEELRELRELLKPRNIFKRINLWFTHSGFIRIKQLDIRIKYQKKVNKILNSYVEEK